MGFRFRKGFGPRGLRVTVGRRGVGVSTGGRGLRYGVHSSGRKTRTISMPGTGISHVSSTGGGRKKTGIGVGLLAAALGGLLSGRKQRRR
jgi:MYXO-CTERM domain-containing protein